MRPLLATRGCLVLALVWLGPPVLGIGTGFAGHMIVHFAVVAIAAPLLAVGLAGSRLDPTPLAPAAVRAAAGHRRSSSSWSGAGMRRRCTPPRAARRPVLALEQVSFLGSASWSGSRPSAAVAARRVPPGSGHPRPVPHLDAHDAARRAAGAEPAAALRQPRRRHRASPRSTTRIWAVRSCCRSAAPAT